MLALIDWISKAEGGRRRLPSGVGEPPYSPEVRFLDDPWPAEIGWSFAVRKVSELDYPRRWLAEVAYRMPEAPGERLQEGREFELYEGKKCVARGRLVGAEFRLDQSQPPALPV